MVIAICNTAYGEYTEGELYTLSNSEYTENEAKWDLDPAPSTDGVATPEPKE